MKKDWTYKKLGELTKIKTGKLDANASSADGIYPFFTCSREPLRISSYSYDCECVLVAGNGELNVKYYNGKFDAYQRTYIIEALPDSGIMTYYMYHFFNQYVETLRQKSIGGIIKYIKLGDLTNALIPIPPLSIQRSIVAELDLLHSVISKKKEQLRELDNLAQSLFYQMFGDPITNPMGWEIKKLGEVAEAITGITYKPTDVAESGTIVLRSGNIQNGEIDLNDIVRVQRPISDKYFVQEGDILMCSRNGSFRLVGKAAKITAMSEKMTWGAFMTIIRSEINPYILAFLRTPAFRAQLTSAKTTTVNQITIGMLSKIPLPLPPLSLQQSFATKIEAIEAQKQAITQSIHHTEALLAQRMDNYFGI